MHLPFAFDLLSSGRVELFLLCVGAGACLGALFSSILLLLRRRLTSAKASTNTARDWAMSGKSEEFFHCEALADLI